MLNIVLDSSETSNVWGVTNRPNERWHIPKLPTFLQRADISIHNTADNLDSFIYPVLMHEPFIYCRSVILYQSIWHGFWSYIPDSVLRGLREKRGWIIIDIYSEPISQFDFYSMLSALSDSSHYPNNRILLNTVGPQFVDNKRVFNFPSHLESGCYVKKSPLCCPCYCDHPSSYREQSYPHRRFLLLNNYMDYPLAELLATYASAHPDSFLDSSSKIRGENKLALPNALYTTDLNIVLEAYVDFDVIDYPFITEKTFRNIKFKKPFIVIGQYNTLAALRKLGYKTFHPLIDESYDTILDTTERCRSVLTTLNRMRRMSDTEFNDLIEQCKPIVEYNYNHLISRMKQTNTWLEGLKKV